MQLERHETRADVLSYFTEHIAAATSEVLMAVPPVVLPELADALLAARDNGALVALCLYGHPDEVNVALEDVATLVRVWDIPVGFTLLHVDQRRGLVTFNDKLRHADSDVKAISYDEGHIYHLGFPMFVAQAWSMAEEVHVTDPVPLPRNCDSIREATVHATLHLRENNAVGIEAQVRSAPASPEDTFRSFDGQVVSTRQNFVYPSTSNFNGEIGLIVRDFDNERYSMGGVGAYVEDFEGTDIRLRPLD